MFVRMKSVGRLGGKANCRLKWTVGIEYERQLQSIELTRNHCAYHIRNGIKCLSYGSV